MFGIVYFFKIVNSIILAFVKRFFFADVRKLFRERVYKTITRADQSSILSNGQGNLSLFTNDVEIIIKGLEDIITVFEMSFFVLGALGILL